MINKLSTWLIEPSSSITNANDIRRARLLSAMLLPLMILTPIGSITSPFPAEQQAVGFLFVAVTIAYVFSRTRYYLPAGIFAVISIFIPPYFTLFATEEFTQFTVVTWLSWMNLPILLASIWLPLRPIIFIWLGNILILLAIPVFVLPEVTYEVFATGIMQLVIFGSIILLSAKIRNKDNEELVAQTIKLEKAINDANESNKAKSVFLSNMSHELRTPLHGILSYAQFGLDKTGKVSEEKLKKYFSLINFSGQRLKILVDDLLDLSKLEAGKMVMDFSRVNLTKIIDDCISEQSALMQSHSITTEINYENETQYIEGDENRIGQIIMNLLSNAIKFSPNNGCISISCVSLPSNADEINSQGLIQFSISDQGEGVSENDINNIFEKFVQSNNNRFSQGGTGLGLSITRELVNAHNGKVWCENSDKGGATFYFVIPVNHTGEIQ